MFQCFIIICTLPLHSRPGSYLSILICLLNWKIICHSLRKALYYYYSDALLVLFWLPCASSGSLLSQTNSSIFAGLILVNKASCTLSRLQPSPGSEPHPFDPYLSLCIFFSSRFTRLYLSYFSSRTLWDAFIAIAWATVDTSPAHRYGNSITIHWHMVLKHEFEVKT